jgi:hypothetical protein
MTIASLSPTVELQVCAYHEEVFTVAIGSWNLTNPWHRSTPFCNSTLAIESFSRDKTEAIKRNYNMFCLSFNSPLAEYPS